MSRISRNTLPALGVFAAALLFAGPAVSVHADGVAYWCMDRTDGKVQPINEQGACTGFVTANGKKVEFGLKASGVLLASEDGRSVVMLQSGLYAYRNKKGRIATYGRKEVVNPPVVLIYRDGKKVASHRIEDVLVRPKLVVFSTSHIQWTRDRNRKWELLKDELTIKTTSFRDLTFDLETGKLESEDSSEWKSCDVIAYGEVTKQSVGYRMDPAFVAKGKAKRSLVFGSRISHGRDGSYQLLCFSEKSGALVARSRIDIQMNGLTF